MILDCLEDASRYSRMSALLGKAFEALRSGRLAKVSPGRHELDGKRLFALVQEGPTRSPQEALFEAHRQYIDVQFVQRGAEIMGWAPEASLKVRDAYDGGKDVAFYDGTGTMLRVEQGQFVVFWPSDAHMPGLMIDAPALVRKIVLKVAVEE